MQWIDKIPVSVLAVLALILGLAPFSPQPHLWEKLNMLLGGTLHQPVDIFDLFLHGTPVLLLCLKLYRKAALKNNPP